VRDILLVFSVGMYLVVYGLWTAGLTDHLAAGLVRLAGYGPWAATIGTGFGAALLSSVMNNMPGVLVGALSIEAAQGIPAATRELMVYAHIVGCDAARSLSPSTVWRRCLGCTSSAPGAFAPAGGNTRGSASSSPRRCWPPWRCPCERGTHCRGR
jgi:hypothetical protein